MSTALQEDLAEAIVKNNKRPRYKRLNKGELVKSVGYSPKTADVKSTAILQAKGVQDALNKWGLTEELITTALVEDIKSKPGKRLGELSLGSEILALKVKPIDAPQSQTITNNLTQIIINAPYAAETRDKPNSETVPSVASTTEQ